MDTAVGSASTPSALTALQHRHLTYQNHSASSSASDLAALAADHQNEQAKQRRILAEVTAGIEEDQLDEANGKLKKPKLSPTNSSVGVPTRPKFVRKSSATDASLPPIKQPSVRKDSNGDIETSFFGKKSLVKVLIAVLSLLLLARILVYTQVPGLKVPSHPYGLKPDQKQHANEKSGGRPKHQAGTTGKHSNTSGKASTSAAGAQEAGVDAITGTKTAKRSGRKKQRYWSNNEQELTAVIHFLLSGAANALPSVDPELGVDPDLVLDFDSKRKDLLEELESEFWTSKRMVMFTKARHAPSRILKSVIDKLDLIPPPSFIDVDTRPDQEYIEPLLSRLLGRSDLPVVVLNGVIFGGDEALAMQEAGDLLPLLKTAGVIKRPPKPGKFRPKKQKDQEEE